MEGPGPCPRGGSSLKTDSRPGTADSSLSARASPPGPSGFARPPPTGREPVFEVARSSLGLGDPRGHRIPPCRSVAVRSKRPGPRPLAARRLLPGIRCEDRGGSVPRSGSATDAETASQMRVATGERALLPDEAPPCGWALGRPRRAPPSLAVARRRLELRQAPERRHVLVLGIPSRDAGARTLRRANERNQGEGRGHAGGGGVPQPAAVPREAQRSSHELRIPPTSLSALLRVRHPR